MDTTAASGHADASRIPIRRRVALVFTDIVGSTRLLASLGDLAGNRRILEHHRLAARVLRRVGGGEIINTGGDSIFLAFEKPRRALRFALRLQRELRAWLRDEPTHLRVHDRIGLHFGEVEQTQRPDGAQDLTGFAVSLAFSVMELAGPDQILLSQAAFDAARAAPDEGELADFGPLRWLSHGKYPLKGLEEPLPVFEVGEEGTALLQPPSRDPADRSNDEDLIGWRPAIGTEVPGTPWALQRFLGDSRFGEVWLAQGRAATDARALRFCFRPGRVRALRENILLFERLQREIKDHPGIATLHAFHFDHAPHFLESEYVEGVALSELCRGPGARWPIDTEHRLEIIAQTAEALEVAHRAGIVHGDLKPAALVVRPPEERNPQPRVKVTDFGTGLLVATELAEETRLEAAFLDGHLSGPRFGVNAPLYWAPELFKGSTPSPASDIYALGVLLYQVLVGDLTQPVTVDVARRIRDPLLLDDLLACLATDPAARLSSAGELALRLRRLPERRRELLQEERRAYWQGALRTGAVAAVIVGLMGWLAWRALDTAGQARTAADNASAQQQIAEKAAVRLGVANGVRLMEEGDLAGSLVQFVGALQQEPGGAARQDIHRRRIASVVRSAPRQVREWRLQEPAVALAMDEQAEWIAAGGIHGRVSVWRVADGAEMGAPREVGAFVDALGFTPDRRQLFAHAVDGPLRVWAWDERGGSSSSREVSPPVSNVALSPDGKWFAISGSQAGSLALISCEDPSASLMELPEVPGICERLAFSHDGRLLAAAMEGNGGDLLGIWSIPERRLLRTARSPGAGARFLEFDSSGTALLLTTERDVYLLSAATLTPAGPARHHEDLVMWAGFGKQGPLYMSTSAGPGSRAQVSDTTAPGGLPVDLPHPHSVTGGDLSPDGRYVLTGCFDRHLRLWDPSRVQLVAEPARHPAWRNHLRFQVRFLPDGRRAVTMVDDAIRVFDFASHATTIPPLELEEDLSQIALSPDRLRIAGVTRTGTAAVWDGRTGQRLTTRIRFGEPIHQILFGPQGDTLIALQDVPESSSNRIGTVWLASLSQKPPQPTALGTTTRPIFGFFGSPHELNVVSDDGTWRTWNLRNPGAKPVRRDLKAPIDGAVVSKDGAFLAATENSREGRSRVHVWRVSTGERVGVPWTPGFPIRRLSFDPGGTRLLVACRDALLEPRPALQWDVENARVVPPALWHEDGVMAVAFHPTLSRIITGGEDSLVRLWDTSLPRPLISEQRMGYQVLDVVFSDDGELFAAASVDGTARVWDSETGEPVTPVLRHPAMVARVWFTAGARQLVSLSTDGRAYLWDLAPVEDSPDELMRLGDVLKGDSDPGTAGQATRPGLPHERWEPPLPVSSAAIAAWHRRQASLCIKEGHFETALSHLEYAMKAMPDSWALHWQHARLLMKVGRQAEAKADLREVVRLDPDCQAARNRLEQIEEDTSAETSAGNLAADGR